MFQQEKVREKTCCLCSIFSWYHEFGMNDDLGLLVWYIRKGFGGRTPGQ